MKDEWQDVSDELNQDGWQDVSNEIKQPDKSLNVETALRSFGNAALLGYGDNVRAAAEPYIFKALNAITGENVEIEDDYIKRRDEEVKRTRQLQKENPGSSAIGTTAGILTSAAVPAFNFVKGAGALARIGNTAANGFIQGALQNPGEQEGKESDWQLKERAQNALFGTALGAGLQGAGEGALKIARAAPKALNSMADAANFKAFGPMLKDYRVSDVQKLGRYSRDNNLVRLGDSLDDISERVNLKNVEAGNRLDEIYESAGEMFKQKMGSGGFDPIRDKAEIMSAARAELKNTVGGEAALNKLSDYLDTVAAGHGDEPMQMAMAKYNQDVQDYIPKAQQFRKDRAAYRNALGEAGANLDQPVLPGMHDDLQRTAVDSFPVEVHGQDANVMRPNVSDFDNQMSLFPLPERPQGAFNSPRGDDLLPFQHQMVLDDVSTNRYLKEGQQGLIDGTDLVPRTFVDAEGKVITQGRGQMQFAMPPAKPQRPVMPDDIRNPMSPRETNDIKSSLDAAINYTRNPLAKEPAAEIAYSAARNKINEKNLQFLDSLGTEGDQLRVANQEYGMSKQLGNYAKDRLKREDSHKMFGLTDTIAGGAAATYGAVTGDWENAVKGMLAKKVVEKYGTSALAVGSDALAKRAEAIMRFIDSSPALKAMGEKSPAALTSVVQNLVARMDQKFLPPEEFQPQRPNLDVPRSAEGPSNTSGINKDEILQKLNGSKYQKVLQNAAANGDGSFNAAHMVLSGRDPEYRKLIQQNNGF
jgi:hypothetical protein